MPVLFPCDSLTDAENIARLDSMWLQVKAASTVQEFDAIWLDWVGYSVIEENPEVTAEHLRADLVDYIKEVCFDAGIYCGDVIDDVDDDSRSFGPHYKG